MPFPKFCFREGKMEGGREEEGEASVVFSLFFFFYNYEKELGTIATNKLGI